jgi:2,5-diketo-D-gluconate reductase B
MMEKQKQTGMPLIGLGTYRLQGKECQEAMSLALELGYRHIDTADVYENHEAIGKAIRHWPRQELFLTSKIRFSDLEPKCIHKAVPRFLKELKTDYLDLLLIHWPNPQANLSEALQAMLAFKQEGVVHAIGVSNFVRFHFQELESRHFPIMTNQIEMHPYLQRRALVEYCKQHGIGITAYRPLAKGAFEEDPVLTAIGTQHGKSASQVALRWLVQQDIVAIPKAGDPKHLRDNLAIFDFVLTEQEMKKIAGLDSNKRYCNPSDLPVYED